MAILLAAVVAGLIQMVLHWFPWRALLGHDLQRIPSYVLGVLGFTVPLTVLLGHWQAWDDILALWAIVFASGFAVAMAYAIDWLIDRVRRSYEQAELAEKLSDETKSDRNE